jgi:hypothetical protein
MAPTTDVEEAASVVAWFHFYTRLYEDDARVARPSHTLLQLLQVAYVRLCDLCEAGERKPPDCGMPQVSHAL